MNLTLYDIVGLGGVCVSIYCYARLQFQRDFAKRLSYSVLNFCSSLMLLTSLSHHFNLSSVIANCVWALLSAYGIYRCAKYIWRDRAGFGATPTSAE